MHFFLVLWGKSSLPQLNSTRIISTVFGFESGKMTPHFTVTMVHVHGFASLLAVTVLLSIYRATGFQNSHLRKLSDNRNIQIRNDPLAYRTVNQHLPSTKHFNGQTTQLSLFGRSSAPVPTQSWIVQFKYVISLLLYSSWQRKLIWALHLVVLYKVGEYLSTEENILVMRNIYHAVTGRGSGLTKVIQEGNTELIRALQIIKRVLLALVIYLSPI